MSDNRLSKNIKKDIDEKAKVKSKVKKINPGTIAKLVREAFETEPHNILNYSPELFRLLSEAEKDKIKIDRKSYFENYVTERERYDLISQLTNLKEKKALNRNDAIKLLELIVTLNLCKEYREHIFKAFNVLEININKEKDLTRNIRRGELANRIEITRGVLLGFDWGGALLEIGLLGKDIAIRNNADRLSGCASLGKYKYEKQDTFLSSDTIHKSVIFDTSAIISTLNKDDSINHKISLKFKEFIDQRIILIIPVESVLYTLSQLSSKVDCHLAKDVFGCLKSIFHFVYSMPLAKESVLNLAISEECKNMDISSLYTILLSKMSGLPLFASDYNVIKAVNKIDIAEKQEKGEKKYKSHITLSA